MEFRSRSIAYQYSTLCVFNNVNVFNNIFILLVYFVYCRFIICYVLSRTAVWRIPLSIGNQSKEGIWQWSIGGMSFFDKRDRKFVFDEISIEARIYRIVCARNLCTFYLCKYRALVWLRIPYLCKYLCFTLVMCSLCVEILSMLVQLKCTRFQVLNKWKSICCETAIIETKQRALGFTAYEQQTRREHLFIP